MTSLTPPRKKLSSSLLAALFLAAILPLKASAQNSFLAHDHWSRGALHRLVTLGALPSDAMMRAWPLSRAVVADLLANAYTTDPSIVRLAARYRSQLLAEGDTSRGLLVRLGPALLVQRGALRAGTMQRDLNGNYWYPGPDALPGRKELSADGEGAVDLTSWLTIGGSMPGGEAESMYIKALTGGIEAWVGRRPFNLGPAPQSDLVLGERNAFDGGGISSISGFRLGPLGRIHGDAIFARLERSGAIVHPYFHAARFTVMPSHRITIGLSRALILGGAGNEPVTAGRVLLSALGFTDVAGKDSDFENQVAAVDLVWRPSGVGLLYAQLGADDSGFAFARVPGVILGGELGRLGSGTDWALGAELVRIEKRCCSYPSWYVHGALADGWTRQGQLLGHALAGAGTQVSISVRFDRPGSVMAGVHLFGRERAAENLFAPDHGGQSAGARIELTALMSGITVTARGLSEWGRSGWRAGHLRVAATMGI